MSKIKDHIIYMKTVVDANLDSASREPMDVSEHEYWRGYMEGLNNVLKQILLIQKA